jgi:hypothetical protein
MFGNITMKIFVQLIYSIKKEKVPLMKTAKIEGLGM